MRELEPNKGRRSPTQWSVIIMGLLRTIVGGSIGLVGGIMTCQPIFGMVSGALVANGNNK